MKRLTTLVLGAVAAATILGACGGDGGALNDIVGGDSTAPAEVPTAVSETEFCGMIQDYKDKADSFDSAFTQDDPKAIEEAFTTMQDVLHDLESAAPSDVKDDLETMVTIIDRMIAIFDKYEWDFTQLAMAPEFEELSADLDSEEMNGASDRLDSYSKDTCGIDTGS